MYFFIITGGGVCIDVFLTQGDVRVILCVRVCVFAGLCFSKFGSVCVHDPVPLPLLVTQTSDGKGLFLAPPKPTFALKLVYF